jgi:hypothetical protein
MRPELCHEAARCRESKSSYISNRWQSFQLVIENVFKWVILRDRQANFHYTAVLISTFLALKKHVEYYSSGHNHHNVDGDLQDISRSGEGKRLDILEPKVRYR